MALQLIVVAISGSVALLADTIHKFSDALTAMSLWIAFIMGPGWPRNAIPTAMAGRGSSRALHRRGHCLVLDPRCMAVNRTPIQSASPRKPVVGARGW